MRDMVMGTGDFAPPGPTGPPATGATAGIPGTWTPAGSVPPLTVAKLQAGQPNVVTASPATPWTTGQFVQTQTTGAAGRATWTGSAWVGGAAPLSEPPPGADPIAAPDQFTIAEIQAWVDAHEDMAEEVLAAEQGRGAQARVTLVDWLQGFVSHRDEGTIPAAEDTET